IAEGTFDDVDATNPIAELDALSGAFRQMAVRLQQSFADLTLLNQALSESESRLKQFFEALPIGVAIHHLDGSVMYFNQTAKDLLGTEPIANGQPDTQAKDYQVYRSGTDSLYPEAELPVFRALRGEAVAVDDLDLHRGDRVISLGVRATPIVDGNGQMTYALVAFEDITARKQAEQLLTRYNQTLEAQVAERTEALRQSEATNQAILSGIPDLLIRIRVDGTYLNFLSGGDVRLILNNSCADITDMREQTNIYDCTPPELSESRMHYVRRAIATNERQMYEYAVDVEGEQRYEEARIVKTGDDEALVIVRDITERKQAEAALEAAMLELERLANLDGLTQVANRRYFDTCLKQEWRRLTREQQPLSLILFDVDFFKQFNDRYGHQAGDDCLIQVARVTQASIRRPADLAARYGGEEFAVILPNTTLEGAISIARTIQSNIQALHISHAESDTSAYVTVSIGITSQVPGQDSSIHRLIGAADAALYRAKREGRNRYAIGDRALR
ncbi:MAG: diguanylate cyclase, partial [Cyanobacteria bacterium J06639_1]